MAETLAVPHYACTCGHRTALPRERVGETLTCGGCRGLRVIIRSKVEGPLPESTALARRLSPGERHDVEQAHDNIRERREHRRTGRINLSPTPWVFLLGLLAPAIAGALAYQNLLAVGKVDRARRLLVLAVGSTLLVHGLIVLIQLNLGLEIYSRFLTPIGAGLVVWAAAGLLAGLFRSAVYRATSAGLALLLALPLCAALVPAQPGVPILLSAFLAYTFGAALALTLAQAPDTKLASESGAGRASVLIPALLALVLALAEGFVARSIFTFAVL